MAAGAVLQGTGSLIGGIGDFVGGLQSAKGYYAAANYAQANARLTGQLTNVNVDRFDRQFQQVQGGTRADVAASGLKMSGSALDIIRSNAQEASLDRSLIQLKGQMDINDFMAQSAQYNAQAHAAETKGTGGLLKGILGFVGAVAAPFTGGASLALTAAAAAM